ncbi:MAG: hypothetical protein V9G12_04890 [Microthrixaceae bacterium]
MRLVDDDGEPAAAMRLADAVEHKGKGLHGGDDVFFAVFLRNFRQLFGLRSCPAPSFTAPIDAAHLGKAFDGLADLAGRAGGDR